MDGISIKDAISFDGYILLDLAFLESSKMGKFSMAILLDSRKMEKFSMLIIC